MTASVAAARQVLADAASTVPGLSGTALPPDVMSVGDTWPVWVESSLVNYCAMSHTFDVLVALGGTDLATAIETGEAFLGPLVLALADVAVVTTAAPRMAQLQPGTATQMPALQVRCQILADL